MPLSFVGNSDEVRLADGSFVVRLGTSVDDVLRASRKKGWKIQLSRSAREMEIVGTGVRFLRDPADQIEFIELNWCEAELTVFDVKVLGCSQREARETLKRVLPPGSPLVEADGGLWCRGIRLALWSSVWGEDDEPVMTAAIYRPGFYDQPVS